MFGQMVPRNSVPSDTSAWSKCEKKMVTKMVATSEPVSWRTRKRGFELTQRWSNLNHRCLRGLNNDGLDATPGAKIDLFDRRNGAAQIV
jgi:hypothetical protein